MARRLIQIARLALLPLPFAFFLLVFALWLRDLLWPSPVYPDDLPGGGADKLLLAFLFVGVVLLQIFAGFPSLLALDARSRDIRRYLITATVASLMAAILVTAPLHAGAARFLSFIPTLTELLWGLSFLAPPLFISYLLAFVLRRFTEAAA